MCVSNERVPERFPTSVSSPHSILSRQFCQSFRHLFPSMPHSSSAHGDHRRDRGGVHRGSPLHQQDKVRGEVHGEALPPPGKPPDGVSPQDGGDGQGDVLMPPPRFSGEDWWWIEELLENNLSSVNPVGNLGIYVKNVGQQPLKPFTGCFKHFALPHTNIIHTYAGV